MAGPLAAFVQLPTDAGNTGKKMRTQTKVIGADTVHEHFFVQVLQAVLLGVYRLAMEQQTVAVAAQNGTTTGFLWAHVPTAITGKRSRMRRITIDSQHSTALATPTAPRIVSQLFTFTGTASGASLTAGKVDTTYPATILDLRTASTGLTVTLTQKIGSGGLAGALTAVGAYAPAMVDLINPPDAEEEWPVIRPGEGIVLYQDIAGTTDDTRKFNPQLVWDDIDVA